MLRVKRKVSIMTPERTLSLRQGQTANLYVWYEHSGYYTAFFPADKVPLVVDSEFLNPGSCYGPFSSHKEAAASGVAALWQLATSGGHLTSQTGVGD